MGCSEVMQGLRLCVLSSMKAIQKSPWGRWVLDILFTLSVILFLLASHFGLITPGSSLIQCNQPNIEYPFTGEQTITDTVLIIVTIVIPFILIFIVEWVLNEDGSESTRPSGAKWAFSTYLSFLVGGFASYFFIEVLKSFVSEPRPHFMNSCRPNLTDSMCNQTWVSVNYADCQNPFNLSYSKVIDTMKSFPSGHACIGVYDAFFMITYLHKRVRVSWSFGIVPWLDLCWIAWAMICGVSRITDFRHHWWDVLVGALIGAAGAYMTLSKICNWFRNLPQADSKQSSESPCLRDESTVTSTLSYGKDGSNHSPISNQISNLPLDEKKRTTSPLI